MDIIERRYTRVRGLLSKMEKAVDKSGKKPKMVVNTLHFILPQSDEGLKMFSIITEFEMYLLSKNAIVIPVLGNEIMFDEVGDEIAKAITVSKMHTNAGFKNRNVAERDAEAGIDIELMEEIKKAAQPQ